ncbi:MAG: carboxymuconolactone decarboxylase family protein [Gammaproteobacteria bacterium]
MTDIARLNLPPVDMGTAPDRARKVLEGAKRQVGFIPNMYANMANLPGLLETYLTGYGRFREEAGFDSWEQELVFLVVSAENGCHYCTAAHGMMAERTVGMSREVVDAVIAGGAPPDPRHAALCAFTRRMFASRGRPTPAELLAFRGAGFHDQHVLGIVLAIAVKTLSNYVNHVCHTELDAAFAPGTGAS